MNTDQITPRLEQGTTIDWSEIRRRMESARQALEQGAAPSSQEKRSIFKARARALAHEPERSAANQGFLPIIEFRLASETYGIESTFVREIYPLKDFTPLPGVPSFVLGVMNARGQILSIVDVKKFFDLPEKGLGQLNKVIILHNEQMEFGILADEVLRAHTIALEAIQTAPLNVSGTGAAYVRGVTDERVIILDAEKILGDEKIIVHQEAD